MKISKKKSKTKEVEETDLSLPDEPNEPSSSISDYSILLYGAKKIGKTSLAARFPDAFFLATEPGTKALRVFTRPVRTWKDFDGYIKLLEKKKHDFKTIVVDTIDNLYEYAFSHVCQKHMIKHPNEQNDYGATWKEITELFKNGVTRLLNLPRSPGVIFVSHDTEKEIELRSGDKIDRVQPTMAKQAMSIVEAVVDVIVNYHYDGKRRFIRLDGAQDIVAGCRIEEHFIREGGEPRVGGDRIVSIPMGDTAQEAYDNFIKAFNNEQETVDPEHPPKEKKKLKIKKK